MLLAARSMGSVFEEAWINSLKLFQDLNLKMLSLPKKETQSVR